DYGVRSPSELKTNLLNYLMCSSATYSALCIPIHSQFTMSDRTQMQLFEQIPAFTGSYGPQRHYSFQTCAKRGLFEPIATMGSDRLANEPIYG
ncbi:hypothetical protein, partial [Paenibacillus odorifer]|uniref:hypothetical protein n=1 Tax=Paenibacillus odorifer TaxID=189426 RepID=UPI001C37900E